MQLGGDNVSVDILTNYPFPTGRLSPSVSHLHGWVLGLFGVAHGGCCHFGIFSVSRCCCWTFSISTFNYKCSQKRGRLIRGQKLRLQQLEKGSKQGVQMIHSMMACCESPITPTPTPPDNRASQYMCCVTATARSTQSISSITFDFYFDF